MTQLSRRLTALGVVLVIGVSTSCSSDDPAADTTPSSATPDTTSATIVTTTGAAASGADTVADRSEIVNFLLATAMSTGVEIDSQCVLDIVARLSDADAKLLGDSARVGGGETPTLSPAGQALGAELDECAVAAITTGG